MAGDWIKMRVNLANDPSVRAMSRDLKTDAYSVVGRLHAFWAWADEHSINGEVVHAKPSDVDELVSMKGFARSMEKVGWLMVSDVSILMPNFQRHNGESAKKRAVDMERKRVQRLSEFCPSSVPLNSGQKVDKSVTREEKRREEESNTEEGQIAAEAAPTVASKPKANRMPDAEWLETLKADPAFAGIDVDREHAKAIRWCAEKRKTLSRMRLVNWLNRCERPLNGQAEFNSAGKFAGAF